MELFLMFFVARQPSHCLSSVPQKRDDSVDSVQPSPGTWLRWHCFHSSSMLASCSPGRQSRRRMTSWPTAVDLPQLTGLTSAWNGRLVESLWITKATNLQLANSCSSDTKGKDFSLFTFCVTVCWFLDWTPRSQGRSCILPSQMIHGSGRTASERAAHLPANLTILITFCPSHANIPTSKM